jgi:peroxiredoxin
MISRPRFLAFLCFAACGTPSQMQSPGAKIADFSVLDHQGNPVTKEDFLGHRTVLWFYPKAGTPG